MHLKSVTLKGFKSFPERTRLDFSPGVSVVVGPNGSGKSNITDAVLWALGEQSPLAVRGQSMQDVIFAGAHGVQARSEAHVEVILDNADGTVDLPATELSISRRLDRGGEGEYRLNGARCRLADVMELLSDTGLGREMHSVVSQGRVEAIVTSKPRDRRMLIEEAAGLGKHRRRRRRAQAKLERTQENLDRALDVEREARTRLRPLKRQAEAAELHERLQRQLDEARWSLAREAARSARGGLQAAEQQAEAARERAAQIERGLADVAARRARAERALGDRGAQREALSARYYAARSAAERVGLRQEAAGRGIEALRARLERRDEAIARLKREAAADVTDAEVGERIAALEDQLTELARSRVERLEAELAELERRRLDAEREAERAGAEAERRAKAQAELDGRADDLRRRRREAEKEVEAARRESARIGSELAAANQFLRSHAGAPGGVRALADSVTVAPGYELALAATLGTRLRSAVAVDLNEANSLLDRSGRDGGAALLAVDTDARPLGRTPLAPDEVPAGAERLADLVRVGDPDAARLVEVLLADVWVVDALEELPGSFAAAAVTRAGRVWSPATRELRQVPAGGEDRVFAERNRRDELVAAVDEAARAQQTRVAQLERLQRELAVAEAERDAAVSAARAAGRELLETREHERHLRELKEKRRRASDEGPDAARRAGVEAALGAERRLAERAERERRERGRRIAVERARAAHERELLPLAARVLAALAGASAALATRVEALDAELQAERETGKRLASALSACASEETRVQAALKAERELVTRAEVSAQQQRDRAADADAELAQVAERLGFDPDPAEAVMPDAQRSELHERIARLSRRGEQLGPVNPLAAQEYADALAHVEELQRQREDLENALRELQGLIRDTDRRIREAFDETFAAAARNFEEVVAELFPGGRGQLRRVREDAGPRAVLGGAQESGAQAADDAARAEVDADAEEHADADAGFGVEIEITPAGKATRRLSLLSGGEKTMTALAFLFAVFLARPCPFYILDEVEAALDDLNIARFLALLRRVSDRAQFVVVTHQRKTMEAADCLYGVSMAGNGVSKVVSRRLPRDAAGSAAA
jgi:chromosome segregation protein